jgi:hypothetical protein
MFFCSETFANIENLTAFVFALFRLLVIVVLGWLGSLRRRAAREVAQALALPLGPRFIVSPATKTDVFSMRALVLAPRLRDPLASEQQQARSSTEGHYSHRAKRAKKIIAQHRARPPGLTACLQSPMSPSRPVHTTSLSQMMDPPPPLLAFQPPPCSNPSIEHDCCAARSVKPREQTEPQVPSKRTSSRQPCVVQSSSRIVAVLPAGHTYPAASHDLVGPAGPRGPRSPTTPGGPRMPARDARARQNADRRRAGQRCEASRSRRVRGVV